ncbi:MAG TPA: hybrid sensor histidine kinase/response regulator [Kofleriaceae bacterium]|nr:hybrid sensor histidine kinase/response regulator [Kofleriaceae bacterium]
MSTVLVAEDEPGLLDSYCELVVALGHQAVAATDGVQALALARSSPPDLVVTDYMMPGASGIEVIRALRSEPSLRDVPVILMSAGRPTDNEREEATLFLTKPVSISQFEQAVRDVLAAPRQRGTVFMAQAPAAAEPLPLAREQMLSWVSHEIKSPLSAAMMAAELALRGLRSGEPRDALELRMQKMQRQLRRMDELVASMLDAAQLQDGKLRALPERVSLPAFLARVTADWCELYPDYAIELVEVPDVDIDADPERLRQILDNLISNAIKYGGEARSVTVSCAAAAGHASISVADRGRGIPSTELPHIFDRFHRVAGQGGRGHGLGLYISAALARLHEGTLTVESEVGRGSTFTVRLPRAG